jgi:hypothetical protein
LSIGFICVLSRCKGVNFNKQKLPKPPVSRALEVGFSGGKRRPRAVIFVWEKQFCRV